MGYNVRLERRVAPTTRITYLTIGILLRLLINDSLGNVTHIVLDEVHERSLDSDFALGLVKKVLAKKDRLRVVIMSATVDSEKVRACFSTQHIDIGPPL